MDVALNLWSDAASLCIFDPELFEGTRPAEQWPPHANPGVRGGLFALVGLQGDGAYVLRLTDSDLTPEEMDLLNDTIGPLGISVRSGRVYASGMDLPGEPAEDYRKRGAGMFVDLASGDYNLLIHEMRPTAAERGLPNYVAVFRTRSDPFSGVKNEPRFLGGREIEEMIERLDSESKRET